jgi:hypothetical protein
MHMPNCNCPRCRAAAQGFGADMFELGEFGEVLGEQEELELAMELLSARNDQELEQFLGNIFRSVGQGLKSVGSFAMKNIVPVLGPALKQIAKTALPIAGGALGSLIPIPGVGTALGSALGGAVANALEFEVAGLDRETADLERARRFVRLAATAIQKAAIALGSGPPEVIARTALAKAASQHLPATANVAAVVAQGQIPRPTGMAAPVATAVAPGQTATMPQFVPQHAQASGRWRRHGSQIVVEGL